MAFLGLILLFVGFAVMIPRGVFPGSTASRNIHIGGTYVQQTPGYQTRRPTGWRRALIRILIGLAIMAVGAFCIDVGMQDDGPAGSGEDADIWCPVACPA